ncbi:MAG: peptide/nickel transport system substrate-binding protein, partial [Kiritimatiellia bacterium]
MQTLPPFYAINDGNLRMKKWRTFLLILLSLAGATRGAEKILTLAYDADPVSLDPHEQLSGGTLQFSHMVFDPLVRWTKDMK